MKLIYWVATQDDDAACYNIRERTKREVLKRLAQINRPGVYSKPKKVVVDYADGFDLMDQCLSEGGLSE